MTRQTLWTLASCAAIAGGLIAAIFWWPLYPLAAAVVRADLPGWRIAAGVFLVAVVALQVGLIGFYLRIAPWAGKRAVLGFLLAFVAWSGFGGVAIFDLVVAPHLHSNHPGALGMEDPLLRSALGPFLACNGLSLGVGYLLLGWAARRSRYFGSVNLGLVIVVAPLFGLSPLLPEALRISTGVLWGSSQIGLGYRLWQWRWS